MDITWDHIYMAIQIVTTLQLLLAVFLNLFERKKRHLLLAYICLLIAHRYSVFFIYTSGVIWNYLEYPFHILFSYIYFGPVLYLYLSNLKNDVYISNKVLIKHLAVPFLICLSYNLLNFNTGYYLLILIAILIYYFRLSIARYKEYVVHLKGTLKTRFKCFFFIIGINIILDIPDVSLEGLAYLGVPFAIKSNHYINDFLYHSIHFPLLYSYFFVLLLYAITEIPSLKKYFISKSFSDTNIKENDKTILKQKVEKLLKEEKLYLDHNLTLDVISNKLNIEKHIASKLIKGTYNLGFYGIVNKYRIEEFKSLLNDENYNHYDLLGLAKESGFKSKSTFYRVFKELEGMTPSEYKKTLQDY